MTHRAATILSTITTTLTGLTTTGARVEQSRAYPVGTYPALTVRMAADVPLGDMGQTMTGRVDRELEVVITAHTRTETLTSTNETTLNAIRAEVWAALTADHTLGLTYVIDCWLVSDDEPEDGQGDADQIINRQDMRWRVRYFHSLTSAEA